MVGPETGGEDFSEFSSIVPGVMTKLGAGNPEKVHVILITMEI